jgi:hypothetical protein
MLSISPHIRACSVALDVLNEKRLSSRMELITDLNRLEELHRIDLTAYLDASLDFDGFRHWWERYGWGSRVLIDDADQIEGSIGLYPLPVEAFESFKVGAVREAELSPMLHDECEMFGCSTWYASGIVLRDDARGNGASLKRLLQFGLGEWIDSGHISYPFQVVAVAEYSIGAKLLEFFDFARVADGAMLPDGFDLYELALDSHCHAVSLLRLKIK